MAPCILEYQWPTHVIACLISILGGLVVLLPARILWYACQARRRALLSGLDHTQTIFGCLRRTAEKILSGNSTASKVVVFGFWFAEIGALAVHLTSATKVDLGLRDVCGSIQDDRLFQAWVTIICVTFIHFIIKFLAAPDKALMWVNPYSLVDQCTIVATGVNLYYNRYWLAFGFLRPICLNRTTSTLQMLHVLKNKNKVNVIRSICLVLSLWLFGAGVIHIAENDGDPHHNYSNNQLLRHWECFYYILITMGTIGYGDIAPVTSIGRAFIVVFGVCCLAVFLSVLGTFGRALLKRKKYRKPYQRTYGKSHLIICGSITFETLSTVVKNFIHRHNSIENMDLVIINKTKPSTELQAFFRRHFNDVHFIQGTVLELSDLKLARVDQATAALILTDRGAEDEDEEDTANIMRATAIKNISPNTRVIIQILQQHNKEQLFNIPSWSWHKVGGDEVICISELKMGFMAQNCLAPGIVTLLSNLLSMRHIKMPNSRDWMDDYLHGADQKIYTGKLSQAFIGMTFSETAEICYSQFGVLLIAVHSNEDRGTVKLRVNPGSRLIILEGHSGFFIASCLSQVRRVATWQQTKPVSGGTNPQIPSSPSSQFLVLARGESQTSFRDNECNQHHPPESLPSTESTNSDEELLEFLGERSNGPRKRLSDDTGSRQRRIIPPHSLDQNLEPLLFSHTGKVHWCLSKRLDDVLLDEDSIREHCFSDHVILVLKTHCVNDEAALTNFLAPLRASSIHSEELKKVIIHVNPDWISHIWKQLANFPGVYVYKPSKSMHADLRALKVQRCSMCVVMSTTERSKVDEEVVDRHVILSTMNIVSLQKLEEKVAKIGVLTNPEVFRKQVLIETDIPLLVVLENDESVAYLHDDAAGDDPSAPVYQSTSYASGRVFLASTLDSLVTTAYLNTHVLMLIRALITGGEASDFEKILAEDVGVVRKTTVNDVTNARRRSSFSLLSLNHGILEKINHQFEYGQLMKWSLRSYSLLCVGLYRLINPHCKDPRYARRFVITNPPPTFRLLPSDKVYVLRPFEMSNRTRHLSLKDSDQSAKPLQKLTPSQSMNQLLLLVSQEPVGRVPRSSSSNNLSAVRDGLFMTNKLNRQVSQKVSLDKITENRMSGININFAKGEANSYNTISNVSNSSNGSSLNNSNSINNLKNRNTSNPNFLTVEAWHGKSGRMPRSGSETKF